MMKKYEPFIAAQVRRTIPSLNQTELVQRRLARARNRDADARKKGNRYTFVPAAVSDRNGYIDLKQTTLSILIGASWFEDVHLTQEEEKDAGGDLMHLRTNAVDFAAWMSVSFTKEDKIILKLDCEGAEHSVIPKMIELGVAPLIDVLFFECHTLNATRKPGEGNGGPAAVAHPTCQTLFRDFLRASPKTLMHTVPWKLPHAGAHDYHSYPMSMEESRQLIQACETHKATIMDDAFLLSWNNTRKPQTMSPKQKLRFKSILEQMQREAHQRLGKS